MTKKILLAISMPLLLLAGRPAGGQEAEPPPKRVVRELERAAKELAAHGRAIEVERVLDVLTRLGEDADDVADLREETAKKLDRAGDEPKPAPRAAKPLRRAASELVKWIAERPEAERPRIAALALELDGTLDECHRLLGHVKHAGKWVTEEAAAAAKRRPLIADAIRRARVLEVPLEEGPSDLPLFPALYGEPGHAVRFGNLAVSSVRFSPEKLARITREALRAVALASWLHGRELKVEIPRAVYPIVLLGTEEDYQRAVDEALANGGLDEKGAAAARKMAAFFDRRGPVVNQGKIEADESAYLFFFLHTRLCADWYGSRLQPCFSAGISNWICMSYLGTRLPGIAWIERDVEGGPASRSVTEREKEKIREMLRLSEAGIAGSRTYMRWLASRGEDPPFKQSMDDEIGRITGDPLIKATFMMEYFFERGVFAALCPVTRKGEVSAAALPGVLDSALGYDLEELERRWRAWLLPLEPGLAERVEAPPAAGLSPEQKRVLAYLAEIRERAWIRTSVPVSLDEDASAACLAHARYLKRHPEQLRVWPDAHEEYPDREGFTPEGSRAGLSSVIMPGVSSPDAAIDGWMGTYFHRLPLLDPGLVRIGWAMEKGIAVLDAGSFVAPAETICEVRWPPDDFKDVPLRFSPELPNPFPGQDQSAWGYPVTLQLFQHEEVPDLTMKLYEGSGAGGQEVPCLLSTPNHPGNPELAPAGSFALIPKAHLAPGTTYTVVVGGMPDRPEYTWKFRTASR